MPGHARETREGKAQPIKAVSQMRLDKAPVRRALGAGESRGAAQALPQGAQTTVPLAGDGCETKGQDFVCMGDQDRVAEPTGV